MVNDSFRGVWVNDPKYDALAGNKIYQLTIAQSVGLSVPDTIVTNRYGHLKRFCEKHKSNVIAKKLQGAASLSLATLEIGDEELTTAAANVSMCPAMYQERITSGKHVRANCFGDKVYSVLIESPDLDWRRNLNCKFSQYKLDDDINLKLVKLLSELKLKMGIMDLMITDGGIIWLEINPQGQFLFAEGLSGLNLKRNFAEYLLKLSEANTTNNSIQRTRKSAAGA
jgi:glutathione synthase/RimK-type ligase-like ATP-grasp enzyme